MQYLLSEEQYQEYVSLKYDARQDTRFNWDVNMKKEVESSLNKVIGNICSSLDMVEANRATSLVTKADLDVFNRIKREYILSIPSRIRYMFN